MNTKTYKGLIALIAVIAANVGIFLLVESFSLNFWINYSFAMVACILTIYINIFSVEKETPMFGYTLAAVSWVYLIVEIIAALVFGKILRFSVLAAFLVQLFILAAFGICYLQTKLINHSIKEQQKARGKDILNFKYILECMKDVQGKVAYADAYRKTIEHAYDSLASGQIRSNEMAAEVEKKVLDKIKELDAAVEERSEEKINGICKEIESLSDERKRILRLRQNF